MNLVRLQYGGGGGELHGATIVVTTQETTLANQQVKLYKKTDLTNPISTKIFSPIVSDTSSAEFDNIQEPDTYVVISTVGTDEAISEDITINSDEIINKIIKTTIISFYKIVTFAGGTDEEIYKMLKAHYNGSINISDYWSVGDTRSITLSAIDSTLTGESQPLQTVTFVILGLEKDTLATPIGTRSKSAITVYMKTPFSTMGTMNDNNTYSWENCKRRTWCNSLFVDSLPNYIKQSVKLINKNTATSPTNSTINVTQDKAFILSYQEEYGTNTDLSGYENAVSDGCDIYSYFESSSNRGRAIHLETYTFWRGFYKDGRRACFDYNTPRVDHSPDNRPFNVQVGFCM